MSRARNQRNKTFDRVFSGTETPSGIDYERVINKVDRILQLGMTNKYSFSTKVGNRSR